LASLGKTLIDTGQIKMMNVAAVKVEISGGVVAMEMGVDYYQRKIGDLLAELLEVAISEHRVIYDRARCTDYQKAVNMERIISEPRLGYLINTGAQFFGFEKFVFDYIGSNRGILRFLIFGYRIFSDFFSGHTTIPFLLITFPSAVAKRLSVLSVSSICLA
jgi:hypothetical protein